MVTGVPFLFSRNRFQNPTIALERADMKQYRETQSIRTLTRCPCTDGRTMLLHHIKAFVPLSLLGLILISNTVTTYPTYGL